MYYIILYHTILITDIITYEIVLLKAIFTHYRNYGYKVVVKKNTPTQNEFFLLKILCVNNFLSKDFKEKCKLYRYFLMPKRTSVYTLYTVEHDLLLPLRDDTNRLRLLLEKTSALISHLLDSLSLH